MDSGTRILVGDDEKNLCESLRLLLGKQGYEIHIAHSGREVIDSMGKSTFDLVLLDLFMPDMDGFEIMKEVKDASPDTVIIVITGYASTESAITALRVGAYDYLKKPFDYEELLKTIENALTNRRLKREHEEMQQALRRANDELERRVEERTMELAAANVALEKEISERLCSERALRESEERLKLALEATSDGLWDWDLQTGEVYFSPRYYAMLGYKDLQFPASFQTWESLLHPEDRNYAVSCVREHIERKKEGFEVEFRLKTKSGRWCWILGRGKVVEWTPDGKPARMVGTHVDITERKRAEEAIRQSSEKIKNFAYSVSHDLKSPAIGIIGLAKFLHNKYAIQLDDRGKNLCEQILKASEQLAALVEKINIYAATRESPLHIEPLDTTELLQTVRDEFWTQLDLRRINWREPSLMPIIHADRLSILRVLRNLVDNAIKYGGNELSEITIGYQEDDDSHVLFVRDDGMGVKKQDFHRIFGLFERNDTSKGVEGAGLGLAIVKEVAEQHGGYAWLEENVSKGITCFVSVSKDMKALCPDAGERAMKVARD
jgi:PAS domain S-box-containing protein